MIHAKDKPGHKYQNKCEQTIKTSEETFKNKFKLTQKIQQLSSPIYERCFSPWTRKRNQSMVKPQQVLDQNNSFVNQHQQAVAETMRNHKIDAYEPNIGDFLRKIQFTKKKPQPKEINLSPDKKASISISQKSQKSQLQNFREVIQEKQLVIYPKQASKAKKEEKKDVKQDEKKGEKTIDNESTVKKHKKKDSSQTLMATVQNFYDPFQHKSKETTIYNMPKGMVNLKLRIKEEESVESKTGELKKESRMPSRMEKTFRKNAKEDKGNYQNENGSNLKSEERGVNGANFNDEETNKNKMMINGTERTFFKTHIRGGSRRSITEWSESSGWEMKRKGSQHQRSKTTDFGQPQIPEGSNYFTPCNKAVRRIKIQQKRSRKVKTQVLQTINNLKGEIKQFRHIRRQSQGPKTTKGCSSDDSYLYRTFMNYRREKGCGHEDNITKTLNLTFHNQKSFKKSIGKVIDLAVIGQ